MDAKQLDLERLETCVFMAAASDKLLPMCEYNAHRDDYLLKPLAMNDGELWQPLVADARRQTQVHTFPIKFLKGRPRQMAIQTRVKR